MDSSSITTTQHPIGIKASTSQFPSSSTRKRSRGSSADEDGAFDMAKEEKRLKARERQRRKRERDRSGRDKSGGSSMVSLSTSAVPVDVASVGVGGVFPPPDEETPQMMNIYGHPPDVIPNANPDTDSNPNPSTPNGHGRGGRGPSDTSNLTPDELAKKDRIRLAARERQRKHRASVKAKRMAEMGLPMITAGGVEQAGIQYVMNQHGQYEPVMEDPVQHPHHPAHPHAHPHPHLHVTQEPPFPVPQSHMTLGQTFAQTLLLSISCTPMLKQHLLRTLHMSEEELNSLEPMIASAWDHWDHERALHYAAATAAANASAPGDHNAASTSYIPPPPNTGGNPNQGPALNQNQSGGPGQPSNLYATDFRERFTRPLVAPFPANAPILRPGGPMHHPHGRPINGSTATNGSYGDRSEDSDENDERGRSPPAPTTTDSIDPNLESEGTSHVRTAETGGDPSAQTEPTIDRKTGDHD
ncbi:hypothetical protein Clacol_009743 [Clathrus columnatus]|uniref:BZIP domain-containing protein n=1 Tax=Clathrus columnatus TaxID=1419009 RepID=A0AAV5AM01_9AGAM|nr:hypothetical protein Clacol_009743 [Clathrus columnatus]